ncbi:carboxypeptidase regulatory-like domain-containing protein [Parendozoicomonas haliclonae]|uniref:Virginiamycin B lyase n=1 Tax=Parendozoicomonas haliclonae TaxID=1960125 RepID=A0A1X7AR99_9GAMM|nr:carboxypeptidase regulatory-like domain-containing protein [Parendozoicomonas haliclonae]SMA50836.1 Virginiamycin B lyase [Parendozoicomonas haliclonae]
MNLLKTAIRLSLVAGLGLPASYGMADTLTGTVTDSQGQPLEGVSISLLQKSPLKQTTLFTNAQGQYTFTEIPDSAFDLRARLIGYRDSIIPFPTASEDSGTAHNFSLEAATEGELLMQLPANVWAERIKFDDEEAFKAFRVNCMTCHTQGNIEARWAQNRENWEVIYNRMAHKGARITAESQDQIAEALIKAYDTSGPLGFPRMPVAPRGKETRVEITEWVMPRGSVPHDVAPGPEGRVYAADAGTSLVVRLDPETDEMVALDDPKSRPENPNSMHTVLPSFDGENVWFIYSAGNMLGKLDVASEEMDVFNVPFYKGVYPHTMRADANGKPWFTMCGSNQLANIDAETGDINYFDLPAKDLWQSMMTFPPFIKLVYETRELFGINTLGDIEELPCPYGIDIAPDGKIWVGQWFGSAIASFDPATESFEKIPTPFNGPRRFRIDSKGQLWIPAFAQGQVYRYIPSSKEWTAFDLPTGRGDAHYALTVNPKDDSVWVAGSNSDTIMRLDPETGASLVYRLPTRLSFVRELYFDEKGDLWTGYANSPAAFYEQGAGSIVRLRVLE